MLMIVMMKKLYFTKFHGNTFQLDELGDDDYYDHDDDSDDEGFDVRVLW